MAQHGITTVAELRTALNTDEAQLEQARANLRILAKGGKVANLTVLGAHDTITGLKAAILNKRALLAKRLAESAETVDLGNNESASTGVFPQADGTFLAMTLTQSRTFKTRGGAESWFARKS